MSAFQEATNKKLCNIIDQLEDQIIALQAERNEFQQAAVDSMGKVEDLQDEINRLRDLIPQAWQAGQSWLMGSRKDFQQTHPTLREWMKQKGIT